MPLTRIMCVGPSRINETMAVLHFDYRIYPKLDKTYIISPYTEKDFRTLFKEFNINDQNIEILPETYFDNHYDLSCWTIENWYKQQAFKLCALDHFDSEYFLIQDSDIIILKPYTIWSSGNLNFKGEELWCPQAKVYSDAVEEFIGLKRTVPYSWVNEIFPYSKQDWQSLKEFIQQRYKKSWQRAITDFRPFDATRWFSEYELLGIYKTNQSTGWTYFSHASQPPIYTWDDFYNTDWKSYGAVKFHARPLKFMTKEEAHKVVEFLNDIN